MRSIGLMMLACLLAEPGVCSQEAPGDKEKILGTWEIVSLEGTGLKPLPIEVRKEARVVITADKLTIEIEGKKNEFAYLLVPGKKPKAIDIGFKGKGASPSPGIYLLKGDDLTLCWDANGEKRPTEFIVVEGKKGGAAGSAAAGAQAREKEVSVPGPPIGWPGLSVLAKPGLLAGLRDLTLDGRRQDSLLRPRRENVDKGLRRLSNQLPCAGIR